MWNSFWWDYVVYMFCLTGREMIEFAQQNDEIVQQIAER